MYDYYRVRWGEIRPPRRPIYATSSGPAQPDLPRVLGCVAGACEFCAAIGFLTTLIAPRGPTPEAGIPFVIALPATVSLAIGLRARQRWTRPLLLGLTVFGFGALAMATIESLVSVLFMAAAALTIVSLYALPSSRSFYASLPLHPFHELRAGDLATSAFAPAWGFLTGVVIGFFATGPFVRFADGSIWTVPTDQIGLGFVGSVAIGVFATAGWLLGSYVERRLDAT